MAYIDIKQTVWERYEIPDDMEIPEFSNAGEVDDFIVDNDITSDILFETMVDMTIAENLGCSTVEVYDDNGDLIFSN